MHCQHGAQCEICPMHGRQNFSACGHSQGGIVETEAAQIVHCSVAPALAARREFIMWWLASFFCLFHFMPRVQQCILVLRRLWLHPGLFQPSTPFLPLATLLSKLQRPADLWLLAFHPLKGEVYPFPPPQLGEQTHFVLTSGLASKPTNIY